jgi:signal transduction histidine kinase
VTTKAGRRSTSALRSGCVAVLASIVLSACGTTLPEGVATVMEASLLLEPGPLPPEDGHAAWRHVLLPDVWSIARRRTAVEGWYRAQVDLAGPPGELWAVYLPQPGFNVAVWVNGNFVGDGGSFDDPVAQNWSRPLFMPVPPALLTGGRNTVDVRLRTDRSAAAVLGPFALGPHRELAPAFARRYRWQVRVPMFLMVIGVAGGLLSACVYLPRDPTGAWRWFAAGMLVFGYVTVNVYTRDVPMPGFLWAWSGAVAQNGFVLCLIMAWHRLLQLARQRLERILWAGAVVGAAALLLVDPLHLRLAMIPWLATGLLLGIYSLFLAVQAAERSSGRGALLMLVPGLLGLAIGAHDVASFLTTRLWAGTLLNPWLAPVVVVATSWLVVSQMAQEMAASERLARDLEIRVQAKHAELERNYQRVRQLERAQAVTAERERIMQDVHDGLGGQLVSTLAMVESGRATSEGVAEALRDALDDLRLVIESLGPTDDDVPTLLAIVRTRLEPRLTRSGLHFDWHVTELPAVPPLGPERALHLLRIVQEAITNVVKHAHAHTITVSTGTAHGPHGTPGVFVEVRDDGCGIATHNDGGRGLSNMARRAAALDGRISVDSGSGGTAVRLWLPLADGADARRDPPSASTVGSPERGC